MRRAARAGLIIGKVILVHLRRLDLSFRDKSSNSTLRGRHGRAGSVAGRVGLPDAPNDGPEVVGRACGELGAR